MSIAASRRADGVRLEVWADAKLDHPVGDRVAAGRKPGKIDLARHAIGISGASKAKLPKPSAACYWLRA
jgi:hypothetical protein